MLRLLLVLVSCSAHAADGGGVTIPLELLEWAWENVLPVVAFLTGGGWAADRIARARKHRRLEDGGEEPPAPDRLAEIEKRIAKLETLLAEVHETICARDADTQGLRIWVVLRAIQVAVVELAEAVARYARATTVRSHDGHQQ